MTAAAFALVDIEVTDDLGEALEEVMSDMTEGTKTSVVELIVEMRGVREGQVRLESKIDKMYEANEAKLDKLQAANEARDAAMEARIRALETENAVLRSEHKATSDTLKKRNNIAMGGGGLGLVALALEVIAYLVKGGAGG